MHFYRQLRPALLFGVAFANIFQGIPIDQEGIFQGNLFTLLNPYGMLGGLLFVPCFWCTAPCGWPSKPMRSS